MPPVLAAVYIQAQVYKPVPTDLPGTAGTAMHTIQNWALGLGLAFCVIGLICGAAMLAASASGHGSPQLSKVGWPVLGALVAAGAAGIIGGVV